MVGILCVEKGVRVSNVDENHELLASILFGKNTVEFTKPVSFKDPEAVADIATFSPSFKMFLEKHLTKLELETLLENPGELYNVDGLYSKHLVLQMISTYEKPLYEFRRKWNKYKEYFPPTSRGEEDQRFSSPTRDLYDTFNTDYEYYLKLPSIKTSGSVPRSFNGDNKILVNAGLKTFDTPGGNRVDVVNSSVYSLAALMDLAMTTEIERYSDAEPWFTLFKMSYYGLSYPFCRTFRKDRRVQAVIKQFEWYRTHKISEYSKPRSKTPTGVEGYIQLFVDWETERLEYQYKQQRMAELYEQWDAIEEKKKQTE